MQENPAGVEKIGPYECIRSIGKGGMGEVLLALDPICEREIALKRIRKDLKNRQSLKKRFLHEAKITAELTHPGIIAIYTISEQEGEIYYTMPYVEGKTLRALLRKEEKASIPSLLPIFKSICQTVAYAHSKGIIHRDLKPENILVGNFGEVIILDWGLAESPFTDVKNEPEEQNPELTHPGKIVGTLAYMAPERALGAPATMQTDIYSLGMILYQMLTLHLPFNRKSIKEFRKNYHLEKLIDPEEIAPYREVPPSLSHMVKKCLSQKSEERYNNLQELLDELLNHMEGRPEWFERARLDITKKKDWEFQENVLISRHIAITRSTEAAAWVSIMHSKEGFAENTRLETNVYIGKAGAGIGFLLSVPEASEKESQLAGYCLWLGTQDAPYSQLFRNTVEVMNLPEIFLKKETWHHLIIEKIENHIHFTLDGIHRFKYVSYLPLVGTHVGIVSRDADFKIDEILVSARGLNLQVSCLSIPDAFLASKDYPKALTHYRRIGASFPGHTESREALFRAGITLLEQAKNSRSEKKRSEFYALSLEEFGKLHQTPGAPLEYLGKALVYESLHDHHEEIKCLELGLRRYQKHPLILAIKEQILYRMHESAQNDRHSAYNLILIALRLMPETLQSNDTLRLIRHLISHWERLPFFENPLEPSIFGKEENPREKRLSEINFAIILAFWLAKPYTLLEIFEDLSKLKPLDAALTGNLLMALFELGAPDLAAKIIHSSELENMLAQLEPLLICHTEGFERAIATLDVRAQPWRTLSFLLQHALANGYEGEIERIVAPLLSQPLSREDRIQLDAYRIWAFLLREQWEKAGELFDTYALELLNQETTLLHPLYGCYLYATEGEEIAMIHLTGVIDTPFPRSWALLGHELCNKILENPAWYHTSFLWERHMLYRQLALYYRIAGNKKLEKYYKDLEAKEESALLM